MVGGVVVVLKSGRTVVTAGVVIKVPSAVSVVISGVVMSAAISRLVLDAMEVMASKFSCNGRNYNINHALEMGKMMLSYFGFKLC